MITAGTADLAAALARRWAAAPPEADGAAGRLAALVADPAGLDLAVRFVDRVIRPEDAHVAARELAALRGTTSAAGFLGAADRLLLAAGSVAAPLAPGLVVPAARVRLRQLVGHLLVDAGPGLGRHLAATYAQGFGVTLNLLGEAVLGDAEAIGRLGRLQSLAARPDVHHVAAKVSALASQLSPWDRAGSAARVRERLRVLCASAARHGTSVTVDMEEYRDLGLTLDAFTALLADPDLRSADLGLAVQAYLPDAVGVVDAVVDAARRRVAAGGTPVKIRLVKGANLSMEHVEARLHGWAAAPYGTKAEVDAAYVRLLDRVLQPELAGIVRLGLGSQNLFHVALAHVVATDRGVPMDVEMLLGMAPAQADAVRRDVGRVLLYTPVVARADLDVAIAYLVRRLEETASDESFVRALLGGGADALDAQEAAFRASVRDAGSPATASRRAVRPSAASEDFANTPDSDPAAPDAVAWLADVRTRQVVAPAPLRLGSIAEVDEAVQRAVTAASGWAATPPARRAAVLRRVALRLEERRADLLATMAREAGKTLAEGDPEVSEAVDFARYYADRAADLADGQVPGAVFRPHGVTVVTPPWNFPVAIPVGSVLAALAAGSPVLIKPAPQTPRSAAVAMAAVHAAFADEGVPADVLQVVETDEGDVGRRLVTHPDVARVVLTGSIETARLFAGWRDDLDVLAETSGKNALVVTASADVDLAVADVVRSAFGHAGQKCSAASLLILVGSAGRSARLRRQLADAVASLGVGPATDPATTMGPLVEPAHGKLLRALTTLDAGEEWLVRPRRLDDAGRLWSPGVKHGVAPGSFFHTTECFGPVLGVMRARTLDEAIDLQNAVAFGLTGGLHSLDEAEIAHWLDRVGVGNAYVNRHITGAVVRRQPFGGWKASVVGPGAKAGGPNYVAQLGRWADAADAPADPSAWLDRACRDDSRFWREELAVTHDPSALGVESDVLRYRPVPHLTVRAGADAAEHHVTRVLHAAAVAGVPVTVSRAPAEPDDAFAGRVATGEVTGRVRLVGTSAGLRAAAHARVGEVTLLDGPVLMAAARELLGTVREQSVSRTRHRFGHIGQADR